MKNSKTVEFIMKNVAAEIAVCRVPLLLLLTAAVFLPGLWFDFAWDDWGLIVNNPSIQSPEWGQFILRSFWLRGDNMADTSRSFFRPLITLSYALDFSIWGMKPLGFHLTNLFMHLAAVWMVYRLARLLRKPAATAWLLAFIFAIHPLRIENVVWIAGRTDVFAGFFFLAATAALIRWADTKTRLAAWGITSLLCYSLALLSKEMALTWPLIAATILWIYHAPWKRRYSFMLSAAGLITVGYLLLRMIALGKLASADDGPGLFVRLANIPVVFLRYIGLLLHLIRPDPHHPESYLPLTAPLIWCGLLLMSAAIAATIILLYRRKIYALGAAWFLLTLTPLYYLGAFGDVLYADRFLYIPSVGFYLFGADILQRLKKINSPLFNIFTSRLLPIIYSVLLLFLSLVYSQIWRNDVKLFRYAAHTSPDSAYILFNLGHALERENKTAAASYAYKRTLELNPSFYQALTNLGIIHLRQGEHRDALFYLLNALRSGDTSHILYESLGRTYRALGNYSAAIEAYLKALNQKPTPAGFNNLGECFLALNETPRARKAFLQALALKTSAAVYINLARTALEEQRPDVALRILQRARPLLPAAPAEHRFQFLVNQAAALSALGDDPAAANVTRQAINQLNELQHIQEAERNKIRHRLLNSSKTLTP